MICDHGNFTKEAKRVLKNISQFALLVSSHYQNHSINGSEKEMVHIKER
jgi:hypothetical protein